MNNFDEITNLKNKVQILETEITNLKSALSMYIQYNEKQIKENIPNEQDKLPE